MKKRLLSLFVFCAMFVSGALMFVGCSPATSDFTVEISETADFEIKDGNVIEMTFGDAINIQSSDIVVTANYEDGSTKVIPNEEFELVLPDLNTHAESYDGRQCYKAGEHTIDILYQDELACQITLRVAKKQVSMSGLEWDYTTPFVYDNETHYVQIKQDTIPAGVGVTFKDYERTSGYCFYTSQGSGDGYYTAKALFNHSSSIELIDTETTELKWQILPKEIDMSGVQWRYMTEYTPERDCFKETTEPFVYDGYSKRVEIDPDTLPISEMYNCFPEHFIKYGASADGNVQETSIPGEYTLNVSFEHKSFKFINAPTSLSWEISKQIINLSDDNIVWEYALGQETTTKAMPTNNAFTYNKTEFSNETGVVPVVKNNLADIVPAEVYEHISWEGASTPRIRYTGAGYSAYSVNQRSPVVWTSAEDYTTTFIIDYSVWADCYKFAGDLNEDGIYKATLTWKVNKADVDLSGYSWSVEEGAELPFTGVAQIPYLKNASGEKLVEGLTRYERVGNGYYDLGLYVRTHSIKAVFDTTNYNITALPDGVSGTNTCILSYEVTKADTVTISEGEIDYEVIENIVTSTTQCNKFILGENVTITGLYNQQDMTLDIVFEGGEYLRKAGYGCEIIAKVLNEDALHYAVKYADKIWFIDGINVTLTKDLVIPVDDVYRGRYNELIITYYTETSDLYKGYELTDPDDRHSIIFTTTGTTANTKGFCFSLNLAGVGIDEYRETRKPHYFESLIVEKNAKVCINLSNSYPSIAREGESSVWVYQSFDFAGGDYGLLIEKNASIYKDSWITKATFTGTKAGAFVQGKNINDAEINYLNCTFNGTYAGMYIRGGYHTFRGESKFEIPQGIATDSVAQVLATHTPNDCPNVGVPLVVETCEGFFNAGDSIKVNFIGQNSSYVDGNDFVSSESFIHKYIPADCHNIRILEFTTASSGTIESIAEINIELENQSEKDTKWADNVLKTDISEFVSGTKVLSTGDKVNITIDND